MRLHPPYFLPLKSFDNLKELTPFWPGWKEQSFNHRYQIFVSVYFCMHCADPLTNVYGIIPKLGGVG